MSTGDKICVIAGGAVVLGLFGLGALGIAAVLVSGYDEPILLSDCASGSFTEADLEAEDARMELLRKWGDELWEDDEDPRATACVEYLNWVESL